MGLPKFLVIISLFISINSHAGTMFGAVKSLYDKASNEFDINVLKEVYLIGRCYSGKLQNTADGTVMRIFDFKDSQSTEDDFRFMRYTHIVQDTFDDLTHESFNTIFRANYMMPFRIKKINDTYTSMYLVSEVNIAKTKFKRDDKMLYLHRIVNERSSGKYLGQDYCYFFKYALHQEETKTVKIEGLGSILQ